MNEQWTALTGQDSQQALGLGWLTMVHPDDQSQAERLFQEANAQQHSFQILYRLWQADGSYHWTLDKGNPKQDTTGQFVGMIGTVTDIHTETLAQQVLEQKEIALSNAVELAELGIWQIDLVRQTAVFSERLTDWVGGPEPATLERAIGAIDPADLPVFLAAYQQAQQPGSDGRLEIEYRLKNEITGRVYLLHSMGQTQFDEQGHAMSLTGFSRDILPRNGLTS